MDGLHRLDVGIAGVAHRVGELASLEGPNQVASTILDRVLRHEAEHPLDLVGVDPVGADVIGGRGDDLDLPLLGHLLGHDLSHHFRRLRDAVVLIAGVEDLPGDLLVGSLEQEAVEIDHVLHMEIGPHLHAAKHRDLAVVDRVVGEDIDREVESLPRRVAADRRRPHGDGRKAGALLCEQHRLAGGLVLVVERHRHQRVLLRHLRRIAHAVHAARGSEDEPPHAGLLGRLHYGPEGVEVHRLREFGVEFHARVVGDAGQVDHSVGAADRFLHRREVADVPLLERKPGMVPHRDQGLLAIDEEIEHMHRIPLLEESRHQHRPHVAAAADHGDLLETA